jgi:predicted P-loop ATPase
MTKKLIQLDDEWGGMSKKEEKFFKALMSKQSFSIREPYGRVSVDLPRLAVFCGTSNEIEIVSDADNNRRLLPINVLSIDFEAYNKIDKTALFICAWNCYKAGYDYKMDAKNIADLSLSSEKHKIVDTEDDLINAYFNVPKSEMYCKLWTNTEVMAYLKQVTQINCSPKKLGMALKKYGFDQKIERRNGQMARTWIIEIKNTSVNNSASID